MNNSTITYCLAWATKRRADFLRGEIGAKCMRRIYQTCAHKGWHIHDLNLKENYIYVEVETPSKLSPHQVVAHLKHQTAKGLRQRYVRLRHLPSVWTRKYLVLPNGYAEQHLQEFVSQQPTV